MSTKYLQFPDLRATKATEIEQTQAVLLRMMKIFDAICSKHDIDYWLDYGTLLGAIRHKGFIPWDYEVDIGILAIDFKKFTEVALRELPTDIFFQTAQTDLNFKDLYIIEAKLRDKYSRYDEKVAYPWHLGIQVDLFVYQWDPSVELALSNRFERVFSSSAIHLKKNEIEYTLRVPFCDTEFPVPVGYDAYLRRAYGDYMLIPPVEERQTMKVFPMSPCDHSDILLWDSND